MQKMLNALDGHLSSAGRPCSHIRSTSSSVSMPPPCECCVHIRICAQECVLFLPRVGLPRRLLQVVLRLSLVWRQQQQPAVQVRSAKDMHASLHPFNWARWLVTCSISRSK